MKKITLRGALVPGIAALALALTACGGDADGDEGGGDSLSGDVVIDGSSTVTPLTEPAAQLFMDENSGVNVPVATSGTGGGFEKFCAGETDISMASRQIAEEEVAACEEAGIEYTELGVANDGLAVVVNPANPLTCVSVDDLKSVWEDGATVDNWSDVGDGSADGDITLYGPGSDSGTFDYFTDAINGEEGNIVAGYNDIGEDDQAAITGVEGDEGAMAFIPLTFANEAGDAVKILEIENESGECVAPSEETVQDGSYNPLGRQLYIYPKGESVQDKPQVKAFVEFYIENSDDVATTAGFIPLTEDQKQEALDALASLE